MTGVVKSNAVFERIGDSQASFREQSLGQRRVVLDLVLAAEVGIFIANGIEGMWIGGNDGFERRAGERSDIGRRQHFVQSFLADPAYVVAGVRFAVIKNAEIDAGLVQQRGENLRDLLIARIE